VDARDAALRKAVQAAYGPGATPMEQTLRPDR
jgi:hypothetical protein